MKGGGTMEVNKEEIKEGSKFEHATVDGNGGISL
jgi:hypothetical protein